MKRDLQNHRFVAADMEWCDLADIIISMEFELFELKNYMNESEISEYIHVIEIYEEEKSKRIKKTSTGVDYSKYLFEDIY